MKLFTGTSLGIHPQDNSHEASTVSNRFSCTHDRRLSNPVAFTEHSFSSSSKSSMPKYVSFDGVRSNAGSTNSTLSLYQKERSSNQIDRFCALSNENKVGKDEQPSSPQKGKMGSLIRNKWISFLSARKMKREPTSHCDQNTRKSVSKIKSPLVDEDLIYHPTNALRKSIDNNAKMISSTKHRHFFSTSILNSTTTPFREAEIAGHKQQQQQKHKSESKDSYLFDSTRKKDKISKTESDFSVAQLTESFDLNPLKVYKRPFSAMLNLRSRKVIKEVHYLEASARKIKAKQQQILMKRLSTDWPKSASSTFQTMNSSVCSSLNIAGHHCFSSSQLNSKPSSQLKRPLDLLPQQNGRSSIKSKNGTTTTPHDSILSLASARTTTDIQHHSTGRRIRLSMHELGFGRCRSYQRLERLGEGTYATVFKGRSLVTGQTVALKEIRLELEEGAPCTAIREVSILRQLRHANVVTLHDVIYEASSLTLVFEYMIKDLKQYLEQDTYGFGINPCNVRLFLYQLLRGLEFCHRQKIIHRDLKPQNLLLSSKGQLKLADFGLARLQTIPSKLYSNEVVTLWYRPPDVLEGSTCYSTSIDMWGVGCIFGEMLQGQPMFPGTVDDQLKLIYNYVGDDGNGFKNPVLTSKESTLYRSPSSSLDNIGCRLLVLLPRLRKDPDGLSLLRQLLKCCPEKRINASTSLKHPYFARCYNLDVLTCLSDDHPVTSIPGMSLQRERSSVVAGTRSRPDSVTNSLNYANHLNFRRFSNALPNLSATNPKFQQRVSTYI